MSSTTVITKTLEYTGSIILSPSKDSKIRQRDTFVKASSAKDIWEWCLTPAALAKCLIRDVLSMSQSQEGFDFYWLGSAPCRTIEICGIVVGIQGFEKKIVYTVDDGTSVIDCVHIPHQPSSTPSLKPSVDSISSSGLPSLKPIACIGEAVSVIGKVKRKYETRVVLSEQITPSSMNDQLIHWKLVKALHQQNYSRPGPFVIPTYIEDRVSQSPQKKRSIEPSSPSTAASSSPKSVISTSKSPPKLRHPSRLRSHNLTDTTFRIYVKHFIDNAQEDCFSSDYDSDNDNRTHIPQVMCDNSRLEDLRTPTKSNRRISSDNTPRPLIAPSRSTALINRNVGYRGFTLSYLRRIPELSLMAKRVVKQRFREQGRRSREKALQSVSKPAPAKLDKTSISAKKKRLFQWAICELLRDGSIVLWDGPRRRCPQDNTYGIINNSSLWKYNSTSTSDGSLFGNASKASSSSDYDDEMELSDPESDEEAYVPTNPEVLCGPIEVAMEELGKIPKKQIVKHDGLVGGFAKEDIQCQMQRDDRWAFVGGWSISDALQRMEEEGRVWRCDSDRWILTR